MNYKKSIPVFLIISLLLFSFSFLVSCSKDELEDTNTSVLNGDATAAQQIPVVSTATTATGNFYGLYDSRTNIFSVRIKWVNMGDSVVAVNLHGPVNSATETAPVLLKVYEWVSGSKRAKSDSLTITLGGLSELSTVNRDHFLNGKVYLEIGTKTYPAGEIRAPITIIRKY